MAIPRTTSVPGLPAALAAFAVSVATIASAAPVLRLEVGPERIVCGVTAPSGVRPHQVRKLGLLVWFHGGMRSQNREKGLEAHRPLLAFADSTRFVMASASAFAGRDWLSPAALGTVDALIDTLHALYPLGDDLRLVGVSDGCLGIIRYASAGKRRAGRKLLISSLPQLAVTEAQLRGDRRLLEGRWDFLQGGRDRLFPAQVVLPFLKEWARLNPDAHLHFFPEGEHDFSYYSTHAADLMRSLLLPLNPSDSSTMRPDRKKPKKGHAVGNP